MKYLKQKDIPSDFEIRNDKIADISITSCRGTFSVNIKFKSKGHCDVGSGFSETHNIGNIIAAYADLLEVDTDNSSNVLNEMIGEPIRVAWRDRFGSCTVDNCYIGHFMEDKWIYLKTLFGRN